jgi:hypothetical protein
MLWGKICVECSNRKECSGVGWLVAGVWKLKGIRKNIKENVFR